MLRRRCVSLLHHVAPVALPRPRNETSLRDSSRSGSCSVGFHTNLNLLLGWWNSPHLSVSDPSPFARITWPGAGDSASDNSAKRMCETTKAGHEIRGARTIVLLSSVTCLGIGRHSCHRWTVARPHTLEPTPPSWMFALVLAA